MTLKTVDEILWCIANHAIAKLNYEDCVVYLKIGDELIQKAAYGPKNPYGFDIVNPIALKKDEGICGAVLASGKAELISDTSLDPRYLVDDSARYSEITVPILFNDEVIGIIDSEHSEKNFYKEQDLEILETIASMASLMIAQTNAQEKVKQQNEELEIKIEERTIELKKTIEELQQSNKEIEKRNQEKETLLKEIHHRVKNNLQIVSSLLSLNSNKLRNKRAQEVFLDCQNRIKSMSLIHEQLYGKTDLAKINAKDYIEEIIQELIRSYKASDKIKVKCDLEELYYDLNVSVPFGLILNELIANSLKYAFPDGKGEILISLKKNNSGVVLSIEDNGCGFNLNEISEDSLGLELVKTLTDQINGKFTIDSSGKGTSCELSFSII